MTTPAPYTAAARRAAALRLALDEAAAREIVADVRRFADDLANGVRTLPPDQQRAGLEAARIARQAADRLERAVVSRIATAQPLVIEDTLAVWRAALAEVAANAGAIPNAAFGAIPLPNLTAAQAFASSRAVGTPWQTLVRDATQRAAAEAEAIIRAGIVARVPPDVLARDLRKYVIGGTSDQRANLERSFAGGTLDLRTVPRELKGAAHQVRYNAERIAFSEVHNAGVAADVAAFGADPLVDAVVWVKAVNRGKVRIPDICDVLAANDFYGLGVATYPVAKVPVPPHPWCRCRRQPRFRSWTDAHDASGAVRAKPLPALQLTAAAAIIPGAGLLTPRGEARIREQLAQLLIA